MEHQWTSVGKDKTTEEVIQEADKLRQEYFDRFKPKDLGNGFILKYYEAEPGSGVLSSRIVKKES